jgi:hypothetical protein
MAPVTYLVCVAAMVAMARYDNARHDEHAFLSQVDTSNNVARSHHATQGVHTTSNILMMQTIPQHACLHDPLACAPSIPCAGWRLRDAALACLG